MSKHFLPSSKFRRSGFSARITIQGQVYPTVIAQKKHCCIHCCADLIRRDSGLVCKQNKLHYGFIKISEAVALTQEERFMKIGDMFPSEYLRGVDSHTPQILTIKQVKSETATSRENGQPMTEHVIYFEETKKKLRVGSVQGEKVSGVMKAMSISDAIGDKSQDTDNWIGKKVGVWGVWQKHFGKMHFVTKIFSINDKDFKAAMSKSKSKPAPPQSTPPQTNSKKQRPMSIDDLRQAAQLAIKDESTPATDEDIDLVWSKLAELVGDENVPRLVSELFDTSSISLNSEIDFVNRWAADKANAKTEAMALIMDEDIPF